MAKGLSREVLAREALALVDDEGLERLSMRRLAARLGVDPMAAYRHVPNKSALLDAVVEALLTSRQPVVPDAPWREQVRSLIGQLLDAMTEHPRAAPLLAERAWTQPGSLAAVETCLRTLVEAGVDPHEAMVALDATGLFLTALARAMSQPPGEDPRAAVDPAQTPVLATVFASGQGVRGPLELRDYWLDAMLDRLAGTIPDRAITDAAER